MAMHESNVEYWAENLGPQGSGFVVCENLLDHVSLEGINAELANPDVSWQVSEDSTDQNGNPVTQKFDVFAHKLSYGNQEVLRDMPHLRSIGDLVLEDIVQPLRSYFPNLSAWEPDEITAQRYKRQVGKLSWHRDLKRHPAIIAVANTRGSAELGVRQHMTTSSITLNEGDILLLRAPGLFDEEPTRSDIRPQHAVTNILGEMDRISVTVRANSTPEKKIKNFYYNNWQ